MGWSYKEDRRLSDLAGSSRRRSTASRCASKPSPERPCRLVETLQ